MTSTARRGWRTVSLRTLMLLVLGAGSLLGVFGRERIRARRQAAAAKELGRVSTAAVEIELRGLWGSRDARQPTRWPQRLLGEAYLQRIVGVEITEVEELERDATFLGDLAYLKRLSLSGNASRFTDRQAAALRPLRNLEQVSLSGAGVSDSGIECLSPANPLRELNLSGSGITDAGLEHIARFVRLERLNLDRTRIGDEGVRTLSGLPRLEALDLSHTLVTDAGLAHLARLPRLKELRMQRVMVDDDGIRALVGCTRLEQLTLGELLLTETAFAHLSQSPSLNHLTLEGPNRSGFFGGGGSQLDRAEIEGLDKQIHRAAALSILAAPNVFWAIERDRHARHPPFLRQLLERGADPNRHEFDGGPRALSVLAARNDLESMQTLLDFGADVNRLDDGGYSALTYAAGEGHLQAIRFLIDRGANPNPPRAETPLGYAAFRKQIEALRLLVALGADANLLNHYDVPPLHIGLEDGAVTQTLLDLGADWRAARSDGTPALHAAVERDLPDALAVLLGHGADANSRDAQGNTPLHRAAALGDRGSEKILLDYGADPSTKNHAGVTPHDLAQRRAARERAKRLPPQPSS